VGSPGASLFISDLHLASSRPDVLQAFHAFLSNRARSAEALFILGDLFESWIGDDDDSALAREVVASLRGLADGGTRIYFLPGNRDFLLGERFAERSGAIALPDPARLVLNGVPVVLTHGDLLCTADRSYQFYRRIVRHPASRRLLLTLPLAVRRGIARNWRRRSRTSVSRKSEETLDASPQAAAQCMRAFRVQLLIHGHTHRPARHDEACGTRFVLGDWQGHGWYVAWERDAAPALHRFEIP